MRSPACGHLRESTHAAANIQHQFSSQILGTKSSALRAAVLAYISGAMFASTEYNLFPYFMVGYVCAMYQTASAPMEAKSIPRGDIENGSNKKLGDARREGEVAWTR